MIPICLIPICFAERQPSASKRIPVGTLAAIVVLIVGLAVLGSAAPAVAQVMSAPAQKTGTTTKTEMVPSLIVMNAQGARTHLITIALDVMSARL
jgi:hypothetical protein